MKRLIVLLLVFTVCSFAQTSVKTVINTGSSATIFNTVLDTVEVSTAFVTKGKEGTATLFIDRDSTGYNTPDSCLVIGYELFETDIGWSTCYDDRATFKGANYTLIDTVDRAILSGENLFMNVAFKNDDWNAADSARFILFHGVGDSCLLRLELTLQ